MPSTSSSDDGHRRYPRSPSERGLAHATISACHRTGPAAETSARSPLPLGSLVGQRRFGPRETMSRVCSRLNLLDTTAASPIRCPPDAAAAVEEFSKTTSRRPRAQADRLDPWLERHTVRDHLNLIGRADGETFY